MCESERVGILFSFPKRERGAMSADEKKEGVVPNGEMDVNDDNPYAQVIRYLDAVFGEFQDANGGYQDIPEHQKKMVRHSSENMVKGVLKPVYTETFGEVDLSLDKMGLSMFSNEEQLVQSVYEIGIRQFETRRDLATIHRRLLSTLCFADLVHKTNLKSDDSGYLSAVVLVLIEMLQKMVDATNKGHMELLSSIFQVFPSEGDAKEFVAKSNRWMMNHHNYCTSPQCLPLKKKAHGLSIQEGNSPRCKDCLLK